MVDTDTLEAPPQVDDQNQQPQPNPGDDKLRLLHTAVGKEYNLGTFEEFKQKIQDPAKRKQFFDAVGKQYDLGSYDDFQKKIGIGQSAPPPAAVPATPPPEHEVTHSPIQDIRHVQEMALKPVENVKDPIGGGYGGKADPGQAAASKAYNAQYDKMAGDLGTQWGADPQVVKQVLTDFPDEQDENKLKGFAGMAKENPVSYNRLKNANDIRVAIAKDGPNGVNDANIFNHLQNAQDYQQLTEENIPYQQQLMREHNLGPDAFDKLKDSQRPLINSADPGLMNKYWTGPDKELGLSPDEFAGLETERLFNPNKAAMDMGVLKHSRGIGDDGKANPVDMSTQPYQYQRGVENVKYQLAQTGRQNLQMYIDGQRPEIDKQMADLLQGYKQSMSFANPAEQQQLQEQFNNEPLVQHANEVENGAQQLQYSESEDNRLYPLNFNDQATRLVRDAIQSKGFQGSDIANTANKVASGAFNTYKGTWDYVKNLAIDIAGSDQQKAFNNAESSGEKSISDLTGYYGAASSGVEQPLNVPRETISTIQGIQNDPNLTADQKEQKSINYLKDNWDQLTTNPKSGQKNLTGKAVLYNAADMTGQILGVASQSFLLGGIIGDASKVQKLATAFTPMYMSTQDQLYQEAVKNGDEHPLLKSNMDAAILSLASLINPDLKVVKAAAGMDSQVGKMIAGVSEETWNRVLSTNKPLLDQMTGGVKAAARQMGLAQLQYGLIAPTAQYLAHKSILGEDANLGDMIKDGVIQTSIQMAAPALLHGLWGGIKATQVNPMQKYALVEAGLHPDQNIDLIDSKIKSGQMSEVQGHEIKMLIKHAGEFMLDPNLKMTDGTPMSEKQVADNLYNSIKKKALENSLKTAPEPLKPVIQEKVHEVNKDIADGFTSEKDKQTAELNQLLHDNLDRIKDKAPEMEQEVKDAIASNTPEDVFKKISDQAKETKKVEGKDVSSREDVEKVFGKPLVEKAIELSKSKTKANENSQGQQANEGGQVTSEKPIEGAGTAKLAEEPASSFLESRHADTVDDEKGLVSGPNDHPISKEGRKDANDLAKEVEGKGVTKIITSDLERSKQTGQVVADKTGATVEHRPELNTWDIGDFDKSSDEEFKKAQKFFVENPDAKEFEGKKINESFNEYKDRVIKARTSLENEPASTLVINHSNNMMLWDAFVKNGHEWNDQAAKDYLEAKTPEPATLTVRPEPPKGKKGENDLPFTEPSKTGIAERVKKEREFDTGVKAPEPGEGASTQAMVDRGRELLGKGEDPEKVMQDFEKDKKISADGVGLVRAQLEQLAKATDKAIEDHGEASKEAQDAMTAESQWAERIQPMQTEWSKIGMAQQGATEIDTGTVTSIKRAFREVSGKPLTEKQVETAKALHSKIKEQETKISDLQKKLDEAINNPKAPSGKGVKEKAADLAKKIRDNAKLNRPGMFSAATPASLVWDSAVEIVAKSVETGGAIADAIGKGIEHIKASDWYKGLSDTQQKKAEKEFSDWHKDEATGKIDIATHFVDKKGNNFTPNESKAIWEHTEKVIEGGKTDFHDVIAQVATDTGLSTEQVRRAISQPKGAKVVTDQMYAAMYRRNQVLQSAKIWVKSADQSAARKFWTSVIKVPSAIVTFGHGSVAPITHVGADLFRPSNWKSYFNFMLDAYKFSFGGLTDKGKASYEKAMGDLVRDPMYMMAKRAGLKIDPMDFKGDDYSNYQAVFGKISKMGERGFNAMKPYRLEQFNKIYAGLSDQAKGNADVVKAIAHMVNLSSGTTDAKIPPGTDLVMFAPKLVASQYQRIFSEPAKAAATFFNWSKATDANKLQAKMVARHAGEMVGTYMAMLAANQAILSMTGSKQKINLTNPLDADWMKFKVGNKTVDASGGMNSALRFVGSLVQEGARANGILKTPEKGKPGDVEGKKILQQMTNKLSPAAGDLVEVFSGTDNGGNSLPWSSVKPSAGREKLTWGGYMETKLPIPIAEGMKTFNDAAKEKGMPQSTLDNYLQAVLIGGLTGTTGARISPDNSKKPSSTGRKLRGE